jgi:hypothetical protein
MSITMYGYLRSHCAISAHEVAYVSEHLLAEVLCWSPSDWRDDPEWPCAAIGTMDIERVDLSQLVPHQVALLRKKQTDLMAAAQAASVEIDRQINGLLAIENAVVSP